jgi:outer membrane protein TolC
MKHFSIFLVLLCVVALTLSIVRLGMTDQATEKKETDSAKLEELYKARIDSLEKLVDILKLHYEAGAATIEEYFQVQEELIEAKLEATDKTAERIALLEEQLKAAQMFFKAVDGRFRAGTVTARDELHAKAHCLKTEIQLYKERAKAKNAG